MLCAGKTQAGVERAFGVDDAGRLKVNYQIATAVSAQLLTLRSVAIRFNSCITLSGTAPYGMLLLENDISIPINAAALEPDDVTLVVHVGSDLTEGLSLRWTYTADANENIKDCDQGAIGDQALDIDNIIDTTPPTVLSAEIGTEGANIIGIQFDDYIYSPSGNYTSGWFVNFDLAPETLTGSYLDAANMTLYLLTTNYALDTTSVTIAYNSTFGDLEDVNGWPDKNALADVGSTEITNNVVPLPDTDRPLVTTFAINSGSDTSTSRTISIDTLTASDNVSAEADMMYMVNTTPDSPPAASDPRWVPYANRLDDLVLPADGTFDVTAYVKDEADNVSRGIGLSVIPITVDTVAPQVTGAVVDATGLLLTITLSESVTGNTGFTLTADGADVALSSPGGSGNQITFVTAQVSQGAALLLSYTAGDVADTLGNSLADFTNTAVTNDSTEAPADLAFHALTPDPTTGEMLGVKTGTGDLTATHTSTVYAQDKDGVYQAFPANDPVWEGARCVLTGAAGSDVDTAYGDDGTGTLLTEAPWLKYQPDATNSLTYSNDLTNAAWIQSGTSVAALDAVGITGAPNSASTLTDDDPSSAESIFHGVFSLTPGYTITHKLWIKKLASDPGSTVKIRQSNIGGTSRNLESYFNAYSGAIVVDGSDASEVIDDGDWWVVLLTVVDTTSDNSLCRIFIWPTGGNSSGVSDNTQTGSIVVGNVESHLNKTIAQVRGLGPIFTTSSAVSTDAIDPLSFDDANHADSGAYYFDWQPAYATSEVSGDLQLLSLNGGADLAYYDGTNGDVESADGTNTATKSQTVADGTTYKVGIAYGDSSLRVNVDGTWGTVQSYDGAFPSGTVLEMFNDHGYSGAIRNLQRYGVSSYDDAESKVEELMA